MDEQDTVNADLSALGAVGGELADRNRGKSVPTVSYGEECGGKERNNETEQREDEDSDHEIVFKKGNTLRWDYKDLYPEGEFRSDAAR